MFEAICFIIAVLIIVIILRRPIKGVSSRSKPPPDSLSDSSVVNIAEATSFKSYSLPEYDEPVLSLSRSHVPRAPHPLRGWTNLGMYAIRGTDPKSGKRRRRHIYALDLADAERKAPSTGLLSPFSIKEVQRPMATEQQIAYCKQLGITVTEHESLVDASALICMVHDGETANDRISDNQWAMACAAEVCISALSCQRSYHSAMRKFSKPLISRRNKQGGKSMNKKERIAHDIAMLYLKQECKAGLFAYSSTNNTSDVIDEMVCDYIDAYNAALDKLDYHSNRFDNLW